VLLNGVVYSVPDTGDDNYGQNLTDYFVAIPSSVLQKSGGSFTLTAETNFGATYGLVAAYYKTRGTNLSSTGVFRLSNTEFIGWRNNANSTDLELGVNTSDQLTFNGNPILPSGGLTASRAVVTTATGLLTAATTTATEIGYVNGVTSAIQTQLDGKQATGSYITALTGDITASGPGSAAATLATVNSNTGAWGSSTAIPSFTVNAKGLITAASTNVVIAPAGTLTGTTLASNVVTSSLTSVGTIAAGVWNGTAIGALYGGTGGSSAASTGLAKVAAGTWSYATLLNADVSASAAITRSKLASGTAYRLLANDSSGVMSENAALTATGVPYADANGQLATNTTDGMIWDQTNKRFSVGTTSPSFQFHIVGSSTGNTGGVFADRYGNTTFLIGRQAGGTSSVPTKTTSGSNMLLLGARGYQETTGAFSTTQRAQIAMLSTEDFTSTAQGTKITIGTTPNGSTTLTTALTLDQDQSATFAGKIIPSAGIVGTATNDNATAGNVGEFTSVNSPTGGTATPGSSGTFVNVASISLTAGDWDVSGTLHVVTGATFAGTRIYGSISKTTADIDDQTKGGVVSVLDSAFPVSANILLPLGTRRISLASTTTIYLTAFLTYSTLGGTTYGTSSFLSARRAR
jgi:hypothetical protein